MKISRTGIVISALPSLLMLGAFYSLAVHMRLTLGHWPDSIGTIGFPERLIAHGRFAWEFYAALLASSMVVVPIGTVICLLAPRWRRGAIYFASFGVFYGVCWGLMLLAPSGFLNWWWD